MGKSHIAYRKILQYSKEFTYIQILKGFSHNFPSLLFLQLFTVIFLVCMKHFTIIATIPLQYKQYSVENKQFIISVCCILYSFPYENRSNVIPSRGKRIKIPFGVLHSLIQIKKDRLFMRQERFGIMQPFTVQHC